MRLLKIIDPLRNNSFLPLASHCLIGTLAAYFIFHPLTMVIYYFEHHSQIAPFSISFNEVVQQVYLAFTLKMLPVGILLALTGGLVGLIYGYHTKAILENKSELAEREVKLKQQILLIEKQASLGIMASSIGHEINNVLTGIIGYTQLLEAEDNKSDRFNKDIKKILKYSFDLTKLSRILLTLGKPPPLTKTKTLKVNLNETLETVTNTLVTCGVLKRIEIFRRYSEQNIQVVCDPFMLEQAIRNIEINASHAMEENGELILETGIYHESNSAYLKIKDSGPGIPQHNLKKIFDPFFSTKDETKGTGLGLSIVKQIVEQFEGMISVRNRDEGGAEFEIILPSC